jgi:ISXO2 transposase-like protein/transposase-like zinc ribbon protein
MARRPKPVPQMTIAQFEAMFPNEEACKSYLQARRWPEGVHCPRCGNTKVFPVRSMPFKWQCYACAPNQGYRFSVIAGTIFENTNKPLCDWFRVVHLMLAGKKGTSALQIQRLMGFGSYETAHSMCHKIRAALIEPEEKLGGIVEVDETYIGGKSINKHGGKSGIVGGIRGKTPIIGAISRKGNVVTRVLERVTKAAAEAFIRETVSDKVSLLATDQNRAYDDLAKYGYKHGVVDHGAKEYVVGAIHTNTIEGFWSIFKRGIVGSFHKVSAKYMPLYVAEFQFRYNNRRNPDMFDTAIRGC